MIDWGFENTDLIMDRLNRLAMDAISRVVFEDGGTDREILYERISGILMLVCEVDESIAEYKRKCDEDRKAFEEASEAAQNAWTDLFEKKTWLKKGGIEDGTDT